MKLEFLPSPRPENIPVASWNSWNWQLRHSLKSQADFSARFRLSADEQAAFAQGSEVFNIRTTPYYASLVRVGIGSKDGELDPIRRMLMPTLAELTPGLSMDDPLGEKQNNPVPRLIHRYPDRVLFLVTDICSVYCRYCTRKHFTGEEKAFVKNDEYSQALKYIESHPGIREVILSGGDPLTVSDSQLLRVLYDLRKIEHVEIIRIGTRMPVVCPMRVTPELAKEIRRYKPVVLMTHFNHPRELTAEAAEAVEAFVDHGVPVFNQMVLLNGVNNHPAIIQALSRRLLFLRAKPYYMFQCDPSEGTDHLRTSIEDSEQIQRELWGSLSGLALPHLSIDIPSGGGKTGLMPNFEVERVKNSRRFRGWDGVEAWYHGPAKENILKPIDANEYQSEWDLLKAAKTVVVERKPTNSFERTSNDFSNL
jgi:lysine 2,3-aminomutase